MLKSLRQSRSVKSAENHSKQKLGRPLPYSIENECDPDATLQYFQVAINVLEGRKLEWANPHSPNSYVTIVLGKKKFRTSIRRNMEDPIFKEFFIFEIYSSIREIQISSIWLAVMEPRCCGNPRLLGESTVDLGAIWAQPNHQVYHKWAQLTLPGDPAQVGPVGFLKVDISIIYNGEIQILPKAEGDTNMEDNILLPLGWEQQRANYIIAVHSAFGIPNGIQTVSSERKKRPSTFVRVSFCGLVAKTGIQYRNTNPMYNEQVCMVEMFPNMDQMICLEVCSAEGNYNKVLGTAQLKLAYMSHDGENGFLPCFGPSLIHMYGGANVTSILTNLKEDRPFHRGALCVTLKTIVPYHQKEFRSVHVEAIPPLLPDNLWKIEDFCIFCPLLELSAIDFEFGGKLSGVAITICDIPSEKDSCDEFMALANDIKQRKLYYTGAMEISKCQESHGYVQFKDGYPILQLVTRLPDFRFRLFNNNRIYNIICNLETTTKETECRLQNYEYSSTNELSERLNKEIEKARENILKFIKESRPRYENNDARTYTTDLDQNQIKLQRDELERIHQVILKGTESETPAQSVFRTISTSRGTMVLGRKHVKYLLSEAKSFIKQIKAIIFKHTEGFPDLVLWLLSNGSRTAFSKISVADIIYSEYNKERGKNCGRIQTVYMKPLKCPKHIDSSVNGCLCIAGQIEIIMWMGLYEQISTFKNFIPTGYSLKTHNFITYLRAIPLVLECRIFIYKGKLMVCHDNYSLSDSNTFVRVSVLNSVKETKVQGNTWKPVWNQILIVQAAINTSPERLALYPPKILVEIYVTNAARNSELVGRFQMTPTMDDRQDFIFAPKLKWFDLYKGDECTGQVLMSAQLLQIPERLLKTKVYESEQENINMSQSHDNDKVETLPENLIPMANTYKVDVYWWGLRDVNITKKPCVILDLDECTIKSEVISERKPNCNFPNGRCSETFKAPLEESYSPSLNISLYDSSTFGRTLLLGTSIIKNPAKFMINWLPKTEREDSLKSASISSNFVQVSQHLFLSKNSNLIAESPTNSSNYSTECSTRECKVKRSTFKRIFSWKGPEEEEYTLLPLLTNIDENRSKPRSCLTERNYSNVKEQIDWWFRYAMALKDNNIQTNKIIRIYDSELEMQPEFFKLKDWCTTLKLYSGKKTSIKEKDEEIHCGILKAGIAIYKWPPPQNIVAVSPFGVELDKGYFQDLPMNNMTKYLIRVYVVKGINLATRDCTGKCDPYVVIDCGKKHFGDRNNHVSKTANPIFGEFYEFRCTLPDDYLLTISLYAYDIEPPPDELIGMTNIDLEDRIYSKHRALVGLAPEYNLSGPGKWRDCRKPSEILEQVCSKNHLPPPMFVDPTSVTVNGVEYKDNNPEKHYTSLGQRRENICLNLLHEWHKMPICGYRLVPEHVETRSLYNPNYPGIEQGKLELWVDIFPLDSAVYIPPPVDVRPRKVDEYQLNVTIWRVKELKMHENNLLTAKRPTDICLKTWIGSANSAQYADMHYSSIFEEGVVEWSVVFDFFYSRAEKKMILKEKGPFTEVEEHLPPTFHIQVIDNEGTSSDECLGSISLTLNALRRGAKTFKECKSVVKDTNSIIDLFVVETWRAWWPLVHEDKNNKKCFQNGCIDMELSLLTKERVKETPIGVVRTSPQSFANSLKNYISEETLTKSHSGSCRSICLSRVFRVAITSLIGFFILGLALLIAGYCFDLFDKFTVISDSDIK